MSITTRSEYGLRALALLAEQLGDERLSASEIARREEIPIKYLEQILSSLKRAGLVQSRAGAHGGYRLTRDPREISVAAVIAAVDGDPGPLPCGAAPAEGPLPFQGSHRLRPLWLALGTAMQDVLRATTLDQLAFSPQLGGRAPAAAPPEPGGGGPMFHI
jgi:Rrf2 family cysteine metabolism transcriptional repressor